MTLRQIIDLFVAMGCEPQEFPGQDVSPLTTWEVYYLRAEDNPDCFVDLTGYDKDEPIAPSVLETWERTLGVQIPRPGQIN
ncbi:MAG TPA: hypothetical protein VN805_14265 [Caulobacteraceae bacterium]|nr:hypothetical protein [Caulobacteraceae bacterium]